MRSARPHAPEDDSTMATSVKRRKRPRRAAERSARSKPTKSTRAAAKPARSRGPTPRPTVIDVHAHVLVPEVMKLTYEHSQYARAVAGRGGAPQALFKRSSDERLRPLWAKAEELGAVIFVHPAGNTDKRMLRNRLMITVGQPLEEAYALSSLIYEGIMDQFPKLKIMVAHGGGYLPFYTGRHDNDYRYGRSPHLKGDFSSYLPRFFYDTVLFNPDMLEFLVTKVPSSHVMLASDYPFAEKRRTYSTGRF